MARSVRITACYVAIACLVLPGGLRSQRLDSATAVPPAPTASQWREDLRVMMEELRRHHKNLYHTTSAAVLDSAAVALSERIPGLARHDVILEMARIVALVGDGHTNIYPTRDPAIGFRTLPIALYLFKDGLHIRAAHEAHSDLLGARVMRIGDATAEQAYERVRPYIGRDNEMGVKFFAPHLLAMPEVLHALRLAPSPDSARFELEIDRRRRTVWLRPVGPAEIMESDTDRSWRRRHRWIDARDRAGAPDPLWLQRDPTTALWWFTRLPESRAVYAQINQVRNGETETFEEFSERLLAFIDTAAVDRLVLDLRLNRGGNGNLLRPLVRGLLRRPSVNDHGRFFVLMGRSTWSAAQFLLNDLEKFAEVIFVGEPSASKGNHYGDSRQIKLPNSGITVRASMYYWQAWSPWDTRPWTAPHVAAELTFADYRANRDPALQAALSYVPRKPLAEQIREAIAAGDTAEARTRVRAFRADPVHAYVDAYSVLDAVAVYFYNRRDIQRATWAFELAVAEYPDETQAHFKLGVVYQLAGRVELARRHFERALDLDPGNESAAARLRQIRQP